MWKRTGVTDPGTRSSLHAGLWVPPSGLSDTAPPPDSTFMGHPVCSFHLAVFHHRTVPDCRRLYPGEPNACPSVLPHRHWPSGRKQALGILDIPQISFMWGDISGLRTIVHFRYGPPVRSPPWLTRPAEHSVSASPRWLSTSQLAGIGSPRDQWDMLRRQTENCAGGTSTRKFSS